MKKLLFTYNPNSGKGAVKAALSDIISTFTTGGYDVMVHPTCCAGDAIDFISQRGRDFDLIVSSGGDGMLHELAYGMSAGKVDCPCGYIPSGTVNDFASSLNIPKDMQKCAAMIMQEHFQPVDLGRFNGGYFAYISAFGWFTDVSYVTPQKTKNVLGSFAYFLQGLKVLRAALSRQGQDHLGARRYRGRFHLLHDWKHALRRRHEKPRPGRSLAH